MRRFSRRRVEPAQLTRRLRRVPHRAVGCGRDVVRARSGRHLVLLKAYGATGGRGTQRAPLPGKHPPDEPEAGPAERTEDQRLTLVEGVARRIRDDAAVGDEDRDRPRRRLCAEQAPCCGDLLAPGGVVLGADRVQQCLAHPGAAEGEAGRLTGAAERAREHRADREREPPGAAPDRARVRASLCGQVALRGAVGEVDRVPIQLREVRRGVSEDEHEAAAAELFDQGGGRSGGRAGRHGEQQHGQQSSDERARGRHPTPPRTRTIRQR